MFKSKKKSSALNAIGFHTSGVSYACVEKVSSEKPKITALEFFACSADEYANTLNKLVKKYQLKKVACNTFLRFDEYKLLVVEAPAVPDNLMIDAIQWEVKDLISFPLADATIDVFPVPVDTLNQNNINVVVAKKAAISQKVDLLKAANLNVNVIDIEELAFRNIAATQEREAQGSVIVVLRKNHGLVLFCKAGELYFSRRLAEGHDSLNEDTSRIESIALEIQRSIDYFERHFTNIGINNLILYPYGKTESAAAVFLNENLSLPCAMLDLSQGLEWLVSADLLDQSRCLLALGTALRIEPDNQ